MKHLLFILLMMAFFNEGQGQIITKAKKDSLQKPVLLITPRLNSAGHFPFSGAFLNHHVNADVNVFYEHRQYGFFVFKSLDLVDRHSIVNYFQPGIFKGFKLAPSLQLRVFTGYIFSQTQSFRDKDSDYFAAAVFYWTIRPNLKLENTSLLFDFNHTTKLSNRLLISYWWKEIKFDFYLWQREVFEVNFHATSASAALNTPKVKISPHISAFGTLSYMRYLTEAKPDFAMKDGLFFTLSFPVSN